MKLLIAIPCLNEAETITDVITAIPQKIEGIDKITILVIDDGSTDETVKIAKKSGAEIVSHPTNLGVGSALHSAISYALDHQFDIMVNIDGDNQFDPNDIPKLIDPVLKGEADMTTASRFIDPALTPDMPPVKKWGNHKMSWLISTLCGQKFYDVSCGFRAYSSYALENLNIHGRFTYTQETFVDMVSKRIRIKEVPIAVRYFEGRESRVAGSILQYAIKTFLIITKIYRDYFPMRFFGAIALVFFVLCLIFGSVFFGHFIMTGKFTGFLFAGFISGFCATLSVLFLILALALDMLDRIRMNQERILYRLKRRQNP